MGMVSKTLDWIFGIKWNRREAEEALAVFVQKERDNAKALSDSAYEDSMRRLAATSKTDSDAAVRIADDLLVRLAFIQARRDKALKIAREEYAALDRRMTLLSRNFISRWIGRIGWRKPQ